MDSLHSSTPTWSKKTLTTLSGWLIEPARAIMDPAARRKARLLSVFLLCLIFLFLSVNFAYLFTVPNYRFPAADLIGYAILATTYLLSRTRYVGLAVFVLLIMFPLNVFGNVIDGTSINLDVTLSFLIPSFLLASILTSALWTAIYGYGINVIVFLLPVLAPRQVPDISMVIGPLAVGIIVVTLCIISIIHRDQIERDRQGELRQAYDNTLEGWSRALEIRDKETEGHSHRVTELTIRLARACGLRGEELDYLYRGALLHDIGKMAIPDSILTKNTILDEDEWAVMRTHPKIAFDMLSAITFLKPALVVPAYHHEWWNGGGYPAGLKGEQIPLPARIFAVVDVWDALLSDRPYRKAWTKESALKYMKEQSGKQFDPDIVEKFIALQE
ncbi:MAG TPA: HD-GYP domain-containing protein [Anaerolineales bacterium]|nr:HD-GYP domain-containing protein [Anaerolineales bacterium]